MKKIVKIILCIVIALILVVGITYAAAPNTYEAMLQQIIGKLNKTDKQLGGENVEDEYFYKKYYTELKEAVLAENKQKCVVKVLDKEIYLSDALIGMANYNLGFNINVAKLDGEYKEEYIKKYTLTKQEAIDIVVYQNVAYSKLSETEIKEIEQEVDAMLDEQITLEKKIAFNYYNEVLNALGMNDKEYKQYKRNVYILTGAANVLFIKQYPDAESSTSDEYEQLKNEFIENLLKDESVTYLS